MHMRAAHRYRKCGSLSYITSRGLEKKAPPPPQPKKDEKEKKRKNNPVTSFCEVRYYVRLRIVTTCTCELLIDIENVVHYHKSAVGSCTYTQRQYNYHKLCTTTVASPPESIYYPTPPTPESTQATPTFLLSNHEVTAIFFLVSVKCRDAPPPLPCPPHFVFVFSVESLFIN